MLQACSIHQSGMRSGSSLGWCRVISTPAMARPVLSSSQVWEQPQGPEPGKLPQRPSCHPTPLQRLCPTAGPTGQHPGPVRTPRKGLSTLSPRSDTQHRSLPWGGPAPGGPAPLAWLGSGERGSFARSVWLPVPRVRAWVVPAGAACRCAGSARLCRWQCFWSCTVIILAASISSGTPTADESVRHRGWQSAWRCRARSGLVWSHKLLGPFLGSCYEAPLGPQHSMGPRMATPTGLGSQETLR